MSERLRTRFGDESGAVLVAGLLLSLALLIVIGAGVDIGHAFIVRRELVSLADDAALTGSQALDLQALHQGRLALDPEQARVTALQALAGGEPGLRGQANANTAAVQVEVQQRVPTILLRLVGVSTLTVGAHATAAPREP
jgi:Flp pilus assembly protein TadG